MIVFWLKLTWGRLHDAPKPLPSILGPYPTRQAAEHARINFERTYGTTIDPHGSCTRASARVVPGTKDGPN